MTPEQVKVVDTVRNQAGNVLVNHLQASSIQEELLDMFMGFLLESLRGCLSPEKAMAHLQSGSPIVYTQAIRFLRENTELRGKELRKAASHLVSKGCSLTTSECQELLSLAADTPQPAPSEGGFWPIWPAVMGSLVFILFFCSSVQAQFGFWPIDVEQNKRLDKIEQQITKIEQSLGDKVPAAKTKEAIATVCPCQGSNKATCFCLAKGIPCKCSAQVGSVWKVEDNKAVSKTGDYANPVTLKLIPAASLAKPKAPQSVTVSASPQYVTVCNGRRCRRIRIR